MKRVLICLLCAVLLCGCSVNDMSKKTQKPTVVATIFPLYDFARQICGDKADVRMLIKPGCEVHSYDPLPSDMAAVYNSDLFIYIGGESDKWVETMLDDNSINSLSFLNEQHHSEHQNEHSHTDEHIWTSPETAILMLEKICQEIVSLDGENELYYKENCDEFVKQIKIAAQETKETVSQYENPFILVADRFPFAHFTGYYGIGHSAAFSGCAVSTDISMKTMSRLTKEIEQRDINTVFVTELSNQNIARALNEQLGVQIVELHSAHNVSADDFSSGISYVDIMYRNKQALERGLKR